MKFILIFVSVILFACVLSVTFVCCSNMFVTDAGRRERNFIDSMFAVSKYDTITGHLAVYKTVTKEAEGFQGNRVNTTDEIGNYFFNITVSDSTLSNDTLKMRSNKIALSVFNRILLKDTAAYHYISVLFFERLKDTVYLFPYKTKNLLNK